MPGKRLSGRVALLPGYGQREGCPSGTWPKGFPESMWACRGEVGPDHLEDPGPTWTGPVLGGLRPGTGQVISRAGVHTASPMGLWASVSQGVETLSCGKDSALKSTGLDWSVSCQKRRAIHLLFQKGPKSYG